MSCSDELAKLAKEGELNSVTLHYSVIEKAFVANMQGTKRITRREAVNEDPVAALTEVLTGKPQPRQKIAPAKPVKAKRVKKELDDLF